ncbi:S8 family serine peptidase [Marinobacter halotolerans]|uniref:S8 family serine peptidase n=1 Tax=Marinobacter halotolerans TaxID=1569211 RepID=UPI00177F0739|nr:S8 family serine peptidase [Marinobacter halotolerans]
MKTFLKTRLIPTAALCLLSTPGLALVGGGASGGPIAPIIQQVEQRARQAVERAMDRRLQEQIRSEAAEVRKQLEELPARAPISTSDGQQAFYDIALENGFRAVQSQWLVTGTAAEIDSLDQPGITVLERRQLSRLGMTLARFRVTEDLDSREALETALPQLADRLDRNHIYKPQASGDAGGNAREVRPRWQSHCTGSLGIGMVDTSIATDHPVFAEARIVQERFLDVAEGELTDAKAHGTAVASLLVGSRNGQWPARLSGATVYNASVFYGQQSRLTGATLSHLLEGLNWLASQPVSVINISLTGPDNRLLAAAVSALRDRNFLLVAAVGNQGPAASPLYPAAYDGVLGITAVDGSGELYRWANRGKQVMFAGPGVSVPVARPGGEMVNDDGTSLASPVIAAALACRRAELAEQPAIDSLIRQARDLGEPGRDPAFGHGFLDL